MPPLCDTQVIAGYYSRISLTRLAQMLDLPADEVRVSVCLQLAPAAAACGCCCCWRCRRTRCTRCLVQLAWCR